MNQPLLILLLSFQSLIFASDVQLTPTTTGSPLSQNVPETTLNPILLNNANPSEPSTAYFSLVNSEGQVEVKAAAPPTSPNPYDLTTAEMTSRQELIIKMAKDAWKAYSEQAWGYEDLQKKQQEQRKTGETILFSMSTLWLMGLWDEFQKGKDWIVNDMKINKKEREIEDISPLLATYALTGDELFKEKAKKVANLFKDNVATNETLSKWASQRLEYRYLSYLTNDDKYWDTVKQLDNYLKTNKNATKSKEAYADKLNIGVKSYYQSDKTDPNGMDFFVEGDKSLDARIQTSFSGLTFVIQSEPKTEMSSEHCNFGAILSLGAQAIQRPGSPDESDWKLSDAGKELDQMKRVVKNWERARNLTETCKLASKKATTGLPPSIFQIDNGATTVQATLKAKGSYRLNPELAESYFVLWRLTHESKYREYAWELAQAINTHARVEQGGFSALDDINNSDSKVNHQPRDFLSATLKYLYLIYTPDRVLPLDKWVFTPEGQPLPVCGKTGAYAADNCAL